MTIAHTNYTYVAPILSVDAVVFQLVHETLQVLLIRRARDPFKGAWALPGGYNPKGETTREALHRVLGAKAGIDTESLEYVEQLYAFDTVARDPRGHAVSITYTCLGRDIVPSESDETQQPQFFALGNLPELAYDHEAIIQFAVDRLRKDITNTTVVYTLLPTVFTLTHVQRAYEAVLGKVLDKRNFRKRFLALGLVEPTGEQYQEGAHRPAALYRFHKRTLQDLSSSFE
jgi:8-oxo-dGTP diphosphatase